MAPRPLVIPACLPLFSAFLPSPCSAAGGEIFDQCVADNDEAFTEKDVIRLARQILSGVAFLHRNNVVHLDLKVSEPRVQRPLEWQLREPRLLQWCPDLLPTRIPAQPFSFFHCEPGGECSSRALFPRTQPSESFIGSLFFHCASQEFLVCVLSRLKGLFYFCKSVVSKQSSLPLSWRVKYSLDLFAPL